MPINVVLRKLDPQMKDGIISTWLKNDGEKVERGEPLAVIDTEKLSFEIEAPSNGILHMTKPVGSLVQVNEVIALIDQPGEEVSQIEKTGKPPKQIEERETVPSEEAKEIIASPLVKKLAKEHGINLSEITGTGIRGMITRDDVLSYVQKTVKVVPEAKEVIPLAGWRKVMAERLSYSKRTAAHITTIAEVDVTELINLRERVLPKFEEKANTRITFTAFVVEAAVQALREHPIINSSLIGNEIVIKKHCNIGIAVAREKEGLVVPVIKHAENRNLVEIAQTLNELTKKAQEGKLSLEEVSGGTFTISNVGMFGVIINTPIINPPESAVLGVGAIVKRPVVINDEIVIRSMMFLCLSYDHRVIDGIPAVRFLQRVKQLLENPNPLLPT